MSRFEALLALELALLWTLAWMPGASSTPVPASLLGGGAFIAYALAVSGAGHMSRGRLWTGAIVARLGLLPAVPTLSEDIYRYMWDGWVLRHGINPYMHAPAASELAGLRTDWWALINHPEVPTIYPPGAQLVFVALAVAGPSWLLFKAAWVLADLLTARLVERLASPARARRALALYLWCPLLLVEVAWNGHLEPLGIAAMLGAVVLAGGTLRPPWAGVSLGLGGSIKFAPLAAVPALWRRRGAGPALIALAVPALLYVPFLAAGEQLFAGLRTYADVWQFNAGLYALLDALPGPPDLPKWLAAAAVLGLAWVAAARRRSVGRALYWTIGAALLLSPTLHPWYVLWVLPLACLYGGRGWILYTGTVFLAYAGRDAYLATGTWPEPVWLKLLIHAPPLALLAWDGWRRAAFGAQRLSRRGQVAEREQGRER